MNPKYQDQPDKGTGKDFRRGSGGTGERSKSPTEKEDQQRMDDDGAPVVQPTYTDVPKRSPQPGAALPGTERTVPESAPHFGDQEPEDPRRLHVDDEPALEDRGEAGTDQGQ